MRGIVCVILIDPENNDLTAETTAPWNQSSLWEIPMLSTLPELYYPRYVEAHGGDIQQVWREGDRRLSAMIEAFRQHPDLRFAELGIGGNMVGNLGFDEQRDLPKMNVVAKAVAVDGQGTVKLSDDAGKHMGAAEYVARYQRLAAARTEVELAYVA